MLVAAAGWKLYDIAVDDVVVRIEQQVYEIPENEKAATVGIEIVNRTQKIIYFRSPFCDDPFDVYQLSADGTWEVRSDLINMCFGVDGGAPAIEPLDPGETKKVTKAITGLGKYKIGFLYYLSPEDLTQSEEMIFTPEFEVIN